MVIPKSKYGSYGLLIGTKSDDIQKGDTVQYIDTKSFVVGYKKKRKKFKVILVGVWDGEKVIFDDGEDTTVRTIKWLTKIN